MSNWIDLKNDSRLRDIYEKRIKIIRLIREFFWSNDFKEVETPVALRFSGQEPYLNPVPIILHDPHGEEHKFYLQTSPEFAMKKLLASGYEKIFQICKCFRDFEQFGGNHNPEFTMIEWYRAPGTIEEIMDDTENLFKFIAKQLNADQIQYKEKNIKINVAWERATMREIWQKFIGVDLNDYLTAEKMATLALERGYTAETDEPYEDLFYKIFLNEIELKLGAEKPIIIYDYPEQMCSLSRLSKNDSRYSERFELYIGGLELANAFGELTDAKEQENRLEIDKQKRMSMSKETWPIDEEFIFALESGLPEAGGIALGVDRMIMLFTGVKDINEVIFQAIGE